MLQCQRSHYHGDGLVAGVAANPGDDGHQGRQCYQLRNGVLEHADHPRGNKRGAEVQGQPGPAGFDRLANRGEHIFILADTPHPAQVGIALFINQIDHLFDRDTAHQLALAIHYCGGEQVIPLEGTGGGFVVVFRIKGDRILRHDLLDQRGGLVEQHSGQGQLPQQVVAPVDDEQLVSVGGDLATQSQIALHRGQTHLGADGDDLEVHHGANGMFTVADHLPHLIPFCGGHVGKQPSHQVARQVLAQIDLVIDIQSAQGVQQLLVAHAADQAVPDGFGCFYQYLATACLIHQCPQGMALIGRQ